MTGTIKSLLNSTYGNIVVELMREPFVAYYRKENSCVLYPVRYNTFRECVLGIISNVRCCNVVEVRVYRGYIHNENKHRLINHTFTSEEIEEFKSSSLGSLIAKVDTNVNF